jgi:hypothetical protein
MRAWDDAHCSPVVEPGAAKHAQEEPVFDVLIEYSIAKIRGESGASVSLKSAVFKD